MKACLNGHYDIAKYLIQKGARINDKDHYGRNALHYAAQSKNEKLVKLICSLENVDVVQHTKISHLTARDFCLSSGNTKDEDGDDIEPRLYNLVLNYENGVLAELSDAGSDDEKTGGEVYKKTKKKKGKGKGKGKAKKGKGKKKKKK